MTGYCHSMTPLFLNFEKISYAVETWVRSKAIQFKSLIAYEENGKIVKEDPRTGKKVIVRLPEKK